MRRHLTLALAGLILLLLMGASVAPIGRLPRLGGFLDPVHGVWAVAGRALPPPSAEAVLPGLGTGAQALIDDRGVPHIFAGSEEDAYRVMGYLVARDRLFQMEIQARATAGTLAELVGARALAADRASRAQGLADAAERSFLALDTTSLGYRAIVAYAEGVNAWIDGLDAADLPLEYRLLGATPAPWEPRYTLYLFGQMGRTLASWDPALERLRIQARVGAAAAEALVPVNSPIVEPIQPNGQAAPRFEFRRVPPPGQPDSAAARLIDLLDSLAPRRGALDVGALGSNSWAVGPSRTSAGKALLSGDPHLQLTLPSIWYEVHVTVPGVLDVAGVSLPGAPGVVIGFNRSVAWTFTNTGGDVMDLYAERVDSLESPTRYLLDGAWRPLRLKVETYRGRGGQVRTIDTVRYTHRGPMRRLGDTWHSVRWTVLEVGTETDVFLRAARSTTAMEWLGVMEGYHAPTQNGLVADRAGTIAIRSSGWYPVRPGDGRGDRIFDGTTTANDWTGYLPVSRYPTSVSPAQGFLASANQQPVDRRANPAYLGAGWVAPFRAMHINQLLRADGAMTPDAMRQMQTDPGSARADQFVPRFLATEDTSHAARLLAEWDRRYDPENQRAVLFELAMREVGRRLFDEFATPGGRAARQPSVSSQVILELMDDPTNPWWDDHATPAVEGRDQILTASLAAAYDSAVANYGPETDGGWRWGTVWPTDIWHLLRMPSLSALGLPVRGGPETIAPAGQRGTHGASWRMVVELGDEVHAMGTYPGGQSGNPASPMYMNRVAGWTRGELDTLLFPKTPEALPAGRVVSRFTFTAGGR